MSEKLTPLTVRIHEATAKSNEGRPGLPQGPCLCEVCRLWRDLTAAKQQIAMDTETIKRIGDGATRLELKFQAKQEQIAVIHQMCDQAIEAMNHAHQQNETLRAERDKAWSDGIRELNLKRGLASSFERVTQQRDKALRERDQARKDGGIYVNQCNRLNEENNTALAESSRLAKELAEATKALNDLGYEKHGIGWVIPVVESVATAEDVEECPLCQQYARELAEVKQQLSAAKSLVIRHHEAGVVQRAGCFCPVCSSDGRDTEYNAVFYPTKGGDEPMTHGILAFRTRKL